VIRFLLVLVLGLPLTAQCITYAPFKSKGRVVEGLKPNGTMTEISGIVVSRHNEGVIWAHDDANNGPYLVALRSDGRLAQQYRIAGVVNRDWEDLSIGPGPVPGRSYLYIADTGDNNTNRTNAAIVRVAEPTVPAQPGGVQTLLGAVVFRIRYPDTPHDCEAMFVDPLDGVPYFVTKERSALTRVYRYPLPLDTTTRKTLVLVGEFSNLIAPQTAADISPDGRWIYTRNYRTIFVVSRPYGTTMSQALRQSKCRSIRASQGQGEALAVRPDGLNLTAISEGEAPVVWQSRGTMPTGGPKALPSVWCFGSGLGSYWGVPGIGTPAVPVLGRTLIEICLWGGKPSTSGFLVFSRTSLPDGKAALAGGWAHVIPDSMSPVTLDANGRGRVPLAILPVDPALFGLKAHGQAAFIDNSAPQGVTLTSGITLLLER
jgi:hypothetical protein